MVFGSEHLDCWRLNAGAAAGLGGGPASALLLRSEGDAWRAQVPPWEGQWARGCKGAGLLCGWNSAQPGNLADCRAEAPLAGTGLTGDSRCVCRPGSPSFFPATPVCLLEQGGEGRRRQGHARAADGGGGGQRPCGPGGAAVGPSSGDRTGGGASAAPRGHPEGALVLPLKGVILGARACCGPGLSWA